MRPSRGCFPARCDCPPRQSKNEDKSYRAAKLWYFIVLDQTKPRAPVWRLHSSARESRMFDHSPADCKVGWIAGTPPTRDLVELTFLRMPFVTQRDQTSSY